MHVLCLTCTQRKFSLMHDRKRRIAPYRSKTEVYAGALRQDLTKAQYGKVHAMIRSHISFPKIFLHMGTVHRKRLVCACLKFFVTVILVCAAVHSRYQQLCSGVRVCV